MPSCSRAPAGPGGHHDRQAQVAGPVVRPHHPLADRGAHRAARARRSGPRCRRSARCARSRTDSPVVGQGAAALVVAGEAEGIAGEQVGVPLLDRGVERHGGGSFAPAGARKPPDRRRSAAAVDPPVSEAERHLVGEQPAPHGQHGPVAVDVDEVVRARRPAAPPPARPPRVRTASCSASSRRSSASSALAGRLGRPAGVDGVDVALGRAHVPEPPARPVRVRGAAERQVLAHRPVEQVVAALVARAGPSSRSRTTRSPAASKRVGRDQVLRRPGRRRRGAGPGRRPAACPARR